MKQALRQTLPLAPPFHPPCFVTFKPPTHTRHLCRPVAVRSAWHAQWTGICRQSYTAGMSGVEDEPRSVKHASLIETLALEESGFKSKACCALQTEKQAREYPESHLKMELSRGGRVYM